MIITVNIWTFMFASIKRCKYVCVYNATMTNDKIYYWYYFGAECGDMNM